MMIAFLVDLPGLSLFALVRHAGAAM